MKLSDYVTDFLAKKGVKHTFGITGGVIVHIFDSIGKHPDINYICTHHEQAAAMAADAYSRVTGNIGVGIATSGPGATNLLTGVCCAFFDSIPALFITGQVPRSQMKGESKARQIGFQETEIINTFKPNTKYAAIVDNPENIRYELEKAFHIAKNGRPGPVLLDLPDDVQRAEINPEELKPYIPEQSELNLFDLERKADKTIELIKKAERPIIILGAGVKLSKSESLTKEFIEKLKFPVALTWGAMDIFPDNYSLSIRDFGVTANRPGNFAVQNSDLILAIGTRLDTHETGSDIKIFAREAKRVVVDIDESELEKYEARGFPVDVPINCDIKDFFNIINKKLDIKTKDISNWMRKIKEWKEKYPICPKEYFKQEPVNPYVFLDVLSQESREGNIIISEAGCNVTWTFQGFKVKRNQKLFTSFNHSPMGYGIPASIGACFANNKEPVIVILGDGGIMMNIHELSTISKHNLPIKIFLMNNQGYGMIQQTQETWLNSRYEASTKESFSLPNFIELAKVHGIEKTELIKNHEELRGKIRKVLDYNGPVLCDVRIHPKARIYPKLSFGMPIEDSAPLLDREEFSKEMIVKPLDAPNIKSKKKLEQPDVESHKLIYHPERVAEWNKKGDCYPIYVEIGPTNVCNHRCIFCALDFLENGGDFIDREVMLSALKEMAKKGIKSIMFAGEGEPLLHKDISLFVQKAKEFGLDVSITTNGIPFTKEKIKSCLPNLSWIRFSVDSGEPENYALIHGTNPEDFNKVIDNIKECVKFRNENNLNTTIGVQFLMIPQNMNQAVKLARILKNIGVDNLQIKPYSHHPKSKNNLILNPEEHDKFEEQILNFNSENFRILFRRRTIKRLESETPYKICHGLPFFALINAKGDIIPCNLFYGDEDFYYGNLYKHSFLEIWNSEKRKGVLRKLRDKGIGSCREGCRLDVINRYLDRLKNPGLHDGFI